MPFFPKTTRIAVIVSLLSVPFVSMEAFAADSASQINDVEGRLVKLRELLNEMELKSEDIKASVDRNKPQPLKMRSAELRMDHVMVFPSYSALSNTAKFSSKTGQRARITFDLEPLSTVKGMFTLEGIGTVAPNRLLPQ